MRAFRAARTLGVGLLIGVSLFTSQPGLANGEMQNCSTPVPVLEETINHKPFQVAKIVVKAKPERVWHVLTDYANASFVFENLKKCQVIEDHGHTKIMDHVVHPSGLPGTFAYRLEVKETPHNALEWHRVSGAFRDVDGYWKLESIESGKATLVTYATYVNGGLFLPAPLIRRQMKTDMPNVMAALKREAESGSTQIARQLEPNKRAN